MDRTCGNCKHYVFYTHIGPVEGYCMVTQGKEKDTYKTVRFDTAASRCNKFEALTEVLTDAYEAPYDPHLRTYGEREK